MKKGKKVAIAFTLFVVTMVFVFGNSALDKWRGWYMSRDIVAHADATLDATALGNILFGKKIEALQSAVIEELASKENGDGSMLPVYVDDNKAGSLPRKDKVSYGCMSYKISTVQREWQSLHGTVLTNLDAALLALDCSKAKALAKEAIFTISGELWNWSAADEKMGARVEAIKSLMQ